MRVLIVDYYYPRFLNSFYSSHPPSPSASYEERRAELATALFGETDFEIQALRALGHEADDVIVNAYPVRRAWAEEHGLRIGAERHRRFRIRRGLVPWIARGPEGSWTWTNRRVAVPWLGQVQDSEWMWSTLLAQVRAYQPDVVHVACMDLVPAPVVDALKGLTPLLVGQVATALPEGRSYKGYRLVISSIPDLVDRFTRDGIAAEWVPLAFEPSLLKLIPETSRDVPVSFVGSFSIAHPHRLAVLDAVARQAPLQTWTADRRALPPGSPVRGTVRGEAFGADMYRVLARSVITINTHGLIAGGAANNLRLYEATGMGALLLTEAGSNLHDLFDVGAEVVPYARPDDAATVVRHFLDHPAEAAAIAAAGQRRTLRDHTWANRMRRLVELYGALIPRA